MDTEPAELRRAAQRFFRRFGALATDSTPCGKPIPLVYAHALMALREGGAMSQQALGEHLCIDKSNVARVCAKLVAAEHATQRASTTDGRSRIVGLTRRGAALAAEVEASSLARFTALLEAIPASRRRDVVASLDLLVVALTEVTPLGASDDEGEDDR